MIFVEKPFENWEQYKVSILDFLQTGEEYILLSTSALLREKILVYGYQEFPDLDLIQFYDLALIEKGELGIREAHWKISEFLTGSKLIHWISRLSVKLHIKSALKFSVRLNLMRERRQSIHKLMKDFSSFGIVVPHYIEPRSSTVIISKSFAEALVEFNKKGNLSFARACFALSRTSNFKCVRILGGSR